jgi:hypothetical protein
MEKNNSKYCYINEKACCEMMDLHLETYPNELIKYDPIQNSYNVRSDALHDWEPGTTYYCMDYCFWCGVKLPSFVSKLYDILEEEYGIHQSVIEDKDFEIGIETRLPEEFKTDKWWKKRGFKGLKDCFKIE